MTDTKSELPAEDGKAEKVAANLREFVDPGSMGVVTDTRYIRCFWPRLDDPVALFEKGSSGIEVQGPPTPTNIIFPDDTKFLNMIVDDGNFLNGRKWRVTDIPTRGDIFYTRRKEMQNVVEEFERTKDLEVDPGVMAEATFMDKRVVQKEVDVITPIEPGKLDLAAVTETKVR